MLTSPEEDDPHAPAPALAHRPATPRAPTTPRGLSARDPSSPGPGRSALRSSWTPSLHSEGARVGAATPRGLTRASLSAWQLAEGGHHHQGAGEYHGSEEPLALRAQLGEARDACQHVTKHLKNVEGLLRALRVSGRPTCTRNCPRALRVGLCLPRQHGTSAGTAPARVWAAATAAEPTLSSQGTTNPVAPCPWCTRVLRRAPCPSGWMRPPPACHPATAPRCPGCAAWWAGGWGRCGGTWTRCGGSAWGRCGRRGRAPRRRCSRWVVVGMHG